MFLGNGKTKSSAAMDMQSSASPVVFSPDRVTNADGLRDRFPSDNASFLPEGVSVGLDVNPFSAIPSWMWWGAGAIAAFGFLMRKRR